MAPGGCVQCPVPHAGLRVCISFAIVVDKHVPFAVLFSYLDAHCVVPSCGGSRVVDGTLDRQIGMGYGRASRAPRGDGLGKAGFARQGEAIISISVETNGAMNTTLDDMKGNASKFQAGAPRHRLFLLSRMVAAQLNLRKAVCPEWH